MIDYLSLIINLIPNKDYLEYHGEIIEDKSRKNIYRFMCKLPKALVLFYPHKFNDERNAKITFTKVIVNPKDFTCYEELESHLFALFDEDVTAKDFIISRIDIASDMQGLLGESLLATVNIKHIRTDTFSFYRGTIYGGSSPRIRIYDKVKEIKARIKKDIQVTEHERSLVDSGKRWTRFEIQIRKSNKTLQDMIDNYEGFAYQYDRLEIFKNDGHDQSGVMQIIYKNVNRKFRKQLDELKDNDFVEQIKTRYIEGVKKWFIPKETF